MNLNSLLRPLCIVSCVFIFGACDKRTAEEKGRDFAKEKIGFVEGATEVLKDKGKTIGESAGKGVADLVKGTGSAVKDAIHPPVKVTFAPELADAGLKLMQAHESKAGADSRSVMVYLSFTKSYRGRLQLRAFNAEGEEWGRAGDTGNISQSVGSNKNIEFTFPGNIRLSKVSHYQIHGLQPKTVTLDSGLKAAGIKVSQLKENSRRVSIYVVFEKSYGAALQLRARNQEDQEIGRSVPTTKLSQDADSASHITFSFSVDTPLADAASYVLHKSKPKSVK